MIPILFENNSNTFTTNGIGRMADAISCIITEERNGIFELTMEYPVSGIHYDELAEERILYAQPRPGASNQAFRIYKISRPLNGVVTVDARHISYQLNKVVVMPFTAGSCAAALTAMVTNAVGSCLFTLTTDKTVVADFEITEPQTFRSLLGGVSGSILDVYGTGEYEWDMYTVKLWQHRGQDNGVTIRYGKNLTELQNETSSSEVYTGIVPYYSDGETVVTLTEKVLWGDYASVYPQLMAIPVDLTTKFGLDTIPTENELRTVAQAYLDESTGWKLSNNIVVSFVNLADTEEYKNVAVLQRVNLCDTVTIVHPVLGVSAQAEVIKVDYNVLAERYDSIELGDAQTNLSQAIMESISEGGEIATVSMMQQAVSHASNLISGGLGGYVVLKLNANKKPEEILIMDDPDIMQATNVIRMNQNGIGFSQNGYDPDEFTTAWTIDGTFYADWITAGTLTANVIRAGLLTSNANTNSYWDLDSGNISLNNATVSGGIFAGAITCSGSIRGGAFYQTVSGAQAGGVSGNGSNGQQASIANGIVTAGQLSVKGSAATISIVPEGQDNRGDKYGMYCTGHFSTNGAIWTNGDQWTADIICRGNSYAQNFIQSSDRRLKTDIKDLDEDRSCEIVYALKPVSFRMISYPSIVHHGFIAQDVQEVVDHDEWGLVVESDVKLIEDKPTLALSYEEIIADLVATVQSQNKRISDLETKVSILMGSLGDK